MYAIQRGPDRRWFCCTGPSSNVDTGKQFTGTFHEKTSALTLTCLLLLIACSGGDTPPDAQEATEPEAVNNPLAEEQALMKEAAKVQYIFNEDAGRKMKAVEDAN